MGVVLGFGHLVIFEIEIFQTFEAFERFQIRKLRDFVGSQLQSLQTFSVADEVCQLIARDLVLGKLKPLQLEIFGEVGERFKVCLVKRQPCEIAESTQVFAVSCRETFNLHLVENEIIILQ